MGIIKKLKIKNIFILGIMGVGFLCSLAGCASDTQKAPCSHFGRFCSKTPINSWASESEAN